MNRALTKENVIEMFPFALSEDKKQSALASATADELVKLYEEDNLVALFIRIDELDEKMCDILAYDFKIDWYLYDGSLTTKRAQIKSLFIIHKRIGTTGAVRRSLSDLYPGTLVEEWFEYGGLPHYFHIVIDVTDTTIPLRLSVMDRLIKIFKPVRSLLEPELLNVRFRHTILVGVTFGFGFLSSIYCGTYPNAAVQGNISNDVIYVAGAVLTGDVILPYLGATHSGTFPITKMQGRIYGNTIEVYEVTQSSIFAADKTGTKPTPATLGKITGDIIGVSTQLANNDVATPSLGATNAGTFPAPRMVGEMRSDIIEAITENGKFSFTADRTNTKPAPSTVGRNTTDTVEVVPEVTDTRFSVPEADDIQAGTHPKATVRGTNTNDSISVSETVDEATYIVPEAKDVNSGTFPRYIEQGGAGAEKLSITVSAAELGFDTPDTGEINNGTFPAAAESGGAESGDISMDSTSGNAAYGSRYCGSPLGSIF